MLVSQVLLRDMRKLRTWRHVESGATSKVGGDAFLRGQSKVGKLNGPTIVPNQDVLRLEIPVVDSLGMAMLDCGKKLQKHVLGLEIITDVVAFLGDLGKQIAFLAVLENNVCALRAVQNLQEGNHIGMLARKVMQLDLAVLESLLAWVESGLGQGLDGVGHVGHYVASLENSSIGPNTDDLGELDTTCQNSADLVLWTAQPKRLGRRWRGW